MYWHLPRKTAKDQAYDFVTWHENELWGWGERKMHWHVLLDDVCRVVPGVSADRYCGTERLVGEMAAKAPGSAQLT